MKNSHVKKLTTCAILIPMAVLLSFITLFHSPLGGSLTLVSMLPITLIGYLYGAKWGFGSAFVYAILQIAVSPSTVSALFLPGEAQEIWWKAILICFLDYILAYTVLGASSLFRNGKHPTRSLVSGTVSAIALRYFVHLTSGALFYGAWAEWYFENFGNVISESNPSDFLSRLGASILDGTGGAALSVLYSAVYNGIYMIPEIILTGIAAFIIGKIPAITGKADFS